MGYRAAATAFVVLLLFKPTSACSVTNLSVLCLLGGLMYIRTLRLCLSVVILMSSCAYLCRFQNTPCQKIFQRCHPLDYQKRVGQLLSCKRMWLSCLECTAIIRSNCIYIGKSLFKS